MMNALRDLKQNEEVSLPDALNLVEQMLERNLATLYHLRQIHLQSPPHSDEPVFRGASVIRTLQPELIAELEALKADILILDNTVEKAILNGDNLRNLSQELLSLLSHSIHKLNTLYQHHAKRFILILGDLTTLYEALTSRLSPLKNIDTTSSQKNLSGQSAHDDIPLSLAEDEKYVFVRVFHRNMLQLGIKQEESLAWIRPLFESLKEAEKHGFAIYAREEEAQKSLKGSAYGYLKVKIKTSQDKTQERPLKRDSIIGINLLTVQDIKPNQIVSLHHESGVYDVKNGILYSGLLPSNHSGE